MTEGHIYLEYDIALESIDTSGLVNLFVQIWNHTSDSYHTVASYNNQNGSFGWIRDTIDIRPFSMNKIFKLRFLAEGRENSEDINFWGIDNINLYRKCDNYLNILTSVV